MEKNLRNPQIESIFAVSLFCEAKHTDRIFMRKIFLMMALLAGIPFCLAQQTNNQEIEIVYGGTLTIDNQKYPEATIFNSDSQRQVQFRHQGLDVWCDIAVLYPKNNEMKAYGRIFVQQGDSLKMESNYIEYNGNTQIAIAKENVVLRNQDMTLETQELIFDRNLQEAYYNHFGKITDKENILTSQQGRYFVQSRKNKFAQNVKISNPEFEVNSSVLNYYHNTGHAYLFGATTIKGKNYQIYTEKGFYNTRTEQGYFVQKSQIDYDFKILKGDSIYFDKKSGFSSATNNISLLDTLNKTLVKGHYAEVYRPKDSLFITQNAVIISEVDKDSVYTHAGKILVTGKPENRVVRAFPNARIYKKDLQAKCDSIHSEQKTGLTQLVGTPVIWSGKNQLTGKHIHLISNVETEQIDSLKVIDDAFIIEKDTLGQGFNQVKGKVLYGKFKDNKLKNINLHQNTEVIYYVYDDKNSLVGINKTKCSRIQVELDSLQQMQSIIFYTDVDGSIYPEEKLPEKERKFPHFLWRGDEMLLRKEDIFSEEEKNFSPKKIAPMLSEEEIDAQEQELSQQTLTE